MRVDHRLRGDGQGTRGPRFALPASYAPRPEPHGGEQESSSSGKDRYACSNGAGPTYEQVISTIKPSGPVPISEKSVSVAVPVICSE